MFLGTHTPKLDDKGRLTLPAKFRDALAGGLMVTKSQDHSLAVYPREQFEALARPPALRQPDQGLRGDRCGGLPGDLGRPILAGLPADPRRELLRGQ